MIVEHNCSLAYLVFSGLNGEKVTSQWWHLTLRYFIFNLPVKVILKQAVVTFSHFNQLLFFGARNFTLVTLALIFTLTI